MVNLKKRISSKTHSLYNKVISKYKNLTEPKIPTNSLAVAINKRPKPEPWGGGNQFLNQLISYLKEHGIEVRYTLKKGIQAILVVVGREDSDPTFYISEIQNFKQRCKNVLCIHRINDCDLPRETSHIDKAFQEVNKYADVTVFISEWIRDYFEDKGFNLSKPSKVIRNGADPNIFYPGNQTIPLHGKPWRIVTHHWSSNLQKGWKLYQEVDSMIASGELKGFELTVIGNWPRDIKWQSARALPPLYGKVLADELRQHHLYLTAARWEACGMHHIEGAQCGLPIVYHEDGGGVVECARLYGIGFRDDVVFALKEAVSNYKELRARVLELAPSGRKVCEEYTALLFLGLDVTKKVHFNNYY